MKKILVLCLAAVLSLALVGCNNKEDVVDNVNPPVQGEQNQENENLGENEVVEDEIVEDENVEDENVEDEISGDENEEGELPEDEEIPGMVENSTTKLMTKLMEDANIQVRMGMQVEIPTEMSEAWLGLKSDKFESLVSESIMYESAISPANESFCIVKLNDASKADEVKQEMFDNCNPRKWVCMSAERVVALNCGEFVMLAMASQDSCNALINTFKAEFGESNVGTVLDKTVSESIENVEDLPGGGMAL